MADRKVGRTAEVTPVLVITALLLLLLLRLAETPQSERTVPARDVESAVSISASDRDVRATAEV